VGKDKVDEEMNFGIIRLKLPVFALESNYLKKIEKKWKIKRFTGLFVRNVVDAAKKT